MIKAVNDAVERDFQLLVRDSYTLVLWERSPLPACRGPGRFLLVSQTKWPLRS